MDVRVEQLRRFVVLAEELSFTRAAARLHVAQQALSTQLKQLEATVGAELLTRTSRRVELTPAGEAFLAGARRVVAETEDAVRAAREAAGHAQLLLACEIDAQWLLADRLEGFAAVEPGIEVVQVYVLDSSALGNLAPSRIDAMVVWGEPAASAAEASMTVANEEVFAVLRADDPLVGDGVVSGPALAGRTLWMWPPSTGTQAWRRFVGHVGASDSTVGIVGHPGGGPAQELMIQAVQDKGGYTFAPVSYLRRTTPAGTAAVPLSPPLRIPLTLAWRAEPSGALRRLLEYLDPR